MKKKQPRVHQVWNLVMKDADIGSNVFPEPISNFTSTPVSRNVSARREAEGVRENLAARDQRDSQRATAPLMVPLGATVINNSA